MQEVCADRGRVHCSGLPGRKKEGHQEVEIDGIARKDNFSEFYVLAHTTVPFGDGEKINNKKNFIIYVYNSNNNLL